MINFKMKHHASGTTYTNPHFFILNKGLNTGKPMKQPCPNCFVIIFQCREDYENMESICSSLWRVKFWHQFLIGSVIPYIRINDYSKMRVLVGNLLAEIQRIKSEGDYEGAKNLVEDYGVKVDLELHKEVKERYAKLNLAPYKGFVNPVYEAIKDKDGNIIDVKIKYTESYTEQMMRYGRDYSPLGVKN